MVKKERENKVSLLLLLITIFAIIAIIILLKPVLPTVGQAVGKSCLVKNVATDGQCPAGQYCARVDQSRALCVSAKADKKSCGRDRECLSGFCDPKTKKCAAKATPTVPTIAKEGETCN